MIVLTFAACAATNNQPEAAAPWDGSLEMSKEPAILFVGNHNWADATVYLLTDGHQTRLGSVTSMTRGTFKIQASKLNAGDVRIRVRLLASREEFTSHRLQLIPGMAMSLEVENQLVHSTFMPYR
jgi:hypothetical protein